MIKGQRLETPKMRQILCILAHKTTRVTYTEILREMEGRFGLTTYPSYAAATLKNMKADGFVQQDESKRYYLTHHGYRKWNGRLK